MKIVKKISVSSILSIPLLLLATPVIIIAVIVSAIILMTGVLIKTIFLLYEEKTD